MSAARAPDEQALARLLLRLENKPGFPALTDSVVAINEITHSENRNMAELSATILKDFGLTANVLRVANSVTYRAANRDGVSTVSRAVSVLGLASLRNIALTVVLFDQLGTGSQARDVKEAMLQAYLAATIARGASASVMPRKAEEVYTCALLHSLGRFIVLLYFPEEEQRMRELISEQGAGEEAAAMQVLGLDLLRLGQGVAAHWAFPQPLVRALRRLPAGVIERPQTEDDMLWVLAAFGNEACASIAENGDPGRAAGLSALRERFAEVMSLSRPELNLQVHNAFDEIKILAGTLGVRLAESALVKRLEAWADASSDTEASEGKPAAAARAGSSKAQGILSAAIDELTSAIVGDFVLDDIHGITQDALLAAMDFQRVLICARDEASGRMVARGGRGKDAEALASRFCFPLHDAPNVFQLAINNGVDMVINDIDDPKIADKIPSWYRKVVSAKTFALMPLVLKGKAVALIYCDKERANAIVISARELNLMKTLRNQALLAHKHAAQS